MRDLVSIPLKLLSVLPSRILKQRPNSNPRLFSRIRVGQYLTPTTPGQYAPTFGDKAGSNYFDRDSHIIHITLTGGIVVEIREAPVVVITFNMPAVTPDEFFDNGNLVENLALFLDVGAGN